MGSHRTPGPVSRRATIAALAAGGLGLAATGSRAAGRQDLADHPLTGWWLATANPIRPDQPQIAVPTLCTADGSFLAFHPVSQLGPDGVQFTSDLVGTWTADSDRRGHFTAVQSLSDLEGTFLGTITIDGYPEVSEDGMTFIDDGSRVVITIRDPGGAVVDAFPGAGGRPVTGTRMGVDAPGFPEATPAS